MLYALIASIIIFSSKGAYANNSEWEQLKHHYKQKNIEEGIERSIERAAERSYQLFIADEIKTNEKEKYPNGYKPNDESQKFFGLYSSYKLSISFRSNIFQDNSVNIKDDFLKKDSQAQKKLVDKYVYEARIYNRLLDKLSSNKNFIFIKSNGAEVARGYVCKESKDKQSCNIELKKIPLDNKKYERYLLDISSIPAQKSAADAGRYDLMGMIRYYRTMVTEGIPYMFKPISLHSDMGIISKYAKLDTTVAPKSKHNKLSSASNAAISKGKQYFHQSKDGANKVMKNLKSKWDNRNNKPAQGA